MKTTRVVVGHANEAGEPRPLVRTEPMNDRQIDRLVSQAVHNQTSPASPIVPLSTKQVTPVPNGADIPKPHN